MNRCIYIILIIFFILSSCQYRKKGDSREEVLLKVALKKGQELIYDVEYSYTLNKPITIGKEKIYYRNIYQNLQIKIIEKHEANYTVVTKILHLRWEDYNKDSLLIALFDSKYKHLNIGYGDNFISSLDLFTKKTDTLEINTKENYHTIDTFSFIPFFFQYPNNSVALHDSFDIQLPIGKYVLFVDTILPDKVLTQVNSIDSRMQNAKYTISRNFGNISEGTQEYILKNDLRYKKIAVKFSQMK